MLYDIVSFLLQIFVSVFAGACLLRVHMQAERVSFANPLGQVVLLLTNWLVQPVRRVVRANGRWDWVGLLLAYALLLVQCVLLLLLAGAWPGLSIAPIWAFFALLRLALSLAMAIVLVHVVLSWIQPGGWLHGLTGQLCRPWLAGLRRMLPTAGGIDLSPLVLLLLLQVAQIMLQHIQADMLSLTLPRL
ncbi:YggT family protein [Corticibacter populi]|uniref:YggT family protein n=1 Tax=Corticibacter populi TaxID=1550736 RepID=A0A3M6R0N9_9BURK|nr:YggT family protein [Corticibacter populi]RMX08449.1 YggT family protein [Corticibacter populi]RZS35758.1 YggT family protein [Corticibacter populi]